MEARKFDVVKEENGFKVKSLKEDFKSLGYFCHRKSESAKDLKSVGDSILIVTNWDNTFTFYYVDYMKKQGKPNEIATYRVISNVEWYEFYDNNKICAIKINGSFAFLFPSTLGVAGVHNTTSFIIGQRILSLAWTKGEKITFRSEFDNLSEGKYVFRIDELDYLVEKKNPFGPDYEWQLDLTLLGTATKLTPYDCILVKDLNGKCYIHEGYQKKFEQQYKRCNKIVALSKKEISLLSDIIGDRYSVKGFWLMAKNGIWGILLFDETKCGFPSRFYQLILDEPVRVLEFRKRIIINGNKADYIDFWRISIGTGKSVTCVKTQDDHTLVNTGDII